MFPAILSAAARKAAARAKALKLGGNTSGDGWQNGGCLVVEKGGGEKPLLYYIQETAPAIVDNVNVLKVKLIQRSNIAKYLWYYIISKNLFFLSYYECFIWR